MCRIVCSFFITTIVLCLFVIKHLLTLVHSLCHVRDECVYRTFRLLLSFFFSLLHIFFLSSFLRFSWSLRSNQLTVHCVDLFYCNCYPLRVSCRIFNVFIAENNSRDCHTFFSLQNGCAMRAFRPLSLDNSRLF